MGEAKRKAESGMQVVNTKKLSVRATWEEFRKAQIPADAHDRVVNACKYSFYVGAVSMFHAVIEGMKIDEEAGLDESPHLEAIKQEVVQFIDEFNAESLRNSAQGSKH